MQLEPLPFAKLMGVTVVSVTPDLVVGELKVREDLCTRPAVLHGGAYMAFADTIGAVATVANLKEGETTTTIESKTNFFAAIPLGDTARAECTPLHKGRTTMVWQTKITRGDGRLAAIVTQTQMVLKARSLARLPQQSPQRAEIVERHQPVDVDRPADREHDADTIVVQISFAFSAGTVGAPGSFPASTASPASPRCARRTAARRTAPPTR